MTRRETLRVRGPTRMWWTRSRPRRVSSRAKASPCGRRRNVSPHGTPGAPSWTPPPRRTSSSVSTHSTRISTKKTRRDAPAEPPLAHERAGDGGVMGISLKPAHLRRYRNIARLLVKYGRGDLMRAAGLDGDLEQGSEVSSVSGELAGPRVHAKPGEILELEARRAQEEKNGKPRAKARELLAGAEPGDRTPQRLAAQLADDLEKMGPTYVKVGQFLSTRPDLLPVSYVEALARLQDEVEPFPFPNIEHIVAEDLGIRLSKAFREFETKPVAAASLGQVHRAQLRSGRLVAVKVQRPRARDRIRADLEVFDEVAGMLDKHTDLGKRFIFTDMVEEFRKSLTRELDYPTEARNLAILGENLAHFERIVVPQPIEGYVTQRVLTMEYISGRKVNTLGPLSKLEMNSGELSEELCRAYLQQIMVDGFFHADPHPGNVLLTDDCG